MEENSLQRTESYELAIQGMQTLGDCGDSLFDAAGKIGASALGAVGGIGESAFDAVGKVGASAFDFASDTSKSFFSTIDNASQRKHERKMKELQDKFARFEMQHNEIMTRTQFLHDEVTLKMRNEHERFVIAEQSKIMQKMIEASLQVFNRKVDFLEKQRDSLELMYREESRIIEEDIRYLENQRRENLNNAEIYSQLSNDLTRLYDTKGKMRLEYQKAQGKLSSQIAILNLDNPLAQNAISQTQTLFIGEK